MPKIIGDPDELITTVRHLARSDIEGIGRKAEERAAQIRREAEQQAELKRQEILATARNRIRDIGRMQNIEVGREEQREYLKAREELLENVRREAGQRLRRLTENEEKYLQVLENLALSAVRLLGPGVRVLQSDPKGHRLLTQDRLKEWENRAGEVLGEGVTFERGAEPLDASGGLLMTDRQGRRVDATFARRLEAAWTELRAEIFAKLVGSNG